MTDPTQEEGDITLQDIVGGQIDEGSRTIYFFESVEPELIQRVIPTLRFLAEESDDPITLECSSPGGRDAPMYALVDAIESLGVPVDLRAYGYLSSAATVLFGVCRHRLVGEHCVVVIHAFGVNLDGSYTAREMETLLVSCRASARRWAMLLSRRTNRDILPFDDLHAIAVGEMAERELVGVELVGAGLADGVLKTPHTSALEGRL